jgi:hypothetical protein
MQLLNQIFPYSRQDAIKNIINSCCGHSTITKLSIKLCESATLEQNTVIRKGIFELNQKILSSEDDMEKNRLIIPSFYQHAIRDWRTNLMDFGDSCRVNSDDRARFTRLCNQLLEVTDQTEYQQRLITEYAKHLYYAWGYGDAVGMGSDDNRIEWKANASPQLDQLANWSNDESSHFSF